jgi:hypothetical protein
MRVKYLIDMLKKYNPDDEIIVNWWDKQWFIDWTDKNITDNEWSNIVVAGDVVLDTTQLAEQLLAAAREKLYKYRNRDNA